MSLDSLGEGSTDWAVTNAHDKQIKELSTKISRLEAALLKCRKQRNAYYEDSALFESRGPLMDDAELEFILRGI